MTRQATDEPLDLSPPQASELCHLTGAGQPMTGGELSFSVWLNEQLWDLERRWSHFCTNDSITAKIDR